MNYQAVLEDIQQDIIKRLSWIIGIFSMIVINITLITRPFPIYTAGITVLLLGLMVSHNVSQPKYPQFLRVSFLFSLHICLWLLILLVPQTWIPFIGLVHILISALLSAYGAPLSGIITGALIYYLYTIGHADYAIVPLILLYGLTVVIANTIRSVLYITVSWYSTMHQRAEQLLHETRERRAELVKIVKSLNIAHENQNRLQQQLINARHQANEARRMKERFAANISHELRTPLNLILGFSEILYFTPEVYGGVSFPPKLHRDIHQIYNNSQHLLEMIDNVLDLSHIELSEFTMNFEPTDLNLFLADAVEMLKDFFRGSAVQFQAQIPPDLPIIEIDRTRFRQVLFNLFSNAQRFTHHGGVYLIVEKKASDILFIVKDTGTGIPPEKLSHIFDEFFQVDYSLSRQHGGAGLGLAVSKRFIEAHSGKIAVHSVLEQGSTFTFNIPINQHHLSANRDSTPSPTESELALIVIDPDPAIGAIIQRYLAHYHVYQIPHTDQLADQLTEITPLAIIHNVHPQQLDTPSPIQHDTIPIIQCSLPSTAWLVMELGVAACLAKPISVEQLALQIRQFPTVRNILVIDDDLGFVQLVQRTIETLNGNFNVYRAYDGTQAIEIAFKSPPDLILLDLAMPEITGFDVIEALHNDPRTASIPIVLLTATRYVQEEISIGQQLTIRRQDGMNPSYVIRSLVGLLNGIAN